MGGGGPDVAGSDIGTVLSPELAVLRAGRVAALRAAKGWVGGEWRAVPTSVSCVGKFRVEGFAVADTSSVLSGDRAPVEGPGSSSN